VHSFLHAIADCVLPLLIRIVNRVNQEVPAQVAEVTVEPLDTFHGPICIKGDPIDHMRDQIFFFFDMSEKNWGLIGFSR
jgi:hypothetical protein